jgi:hypothetical protein
MTSGERLIVALLHELHGDGVVGVSFASVVDHVSKPTPRSRSSTAEAEGLEAHETVRAVFL